MLSVVAADQLSKLLVEHVITRGEERKLDREPAFASRAEIR